MTANAVGTPLIDISSLSRDQRLRLLEQLWDSLAVTPDAVPLTNGQRLELDRRLDAFASDGQTGIVGKEFLEQLRKSRR
jgi:putative addiction module component (TIGR02574 family)